MSYLFVSSGLAVARPKVVLLMYTKLIVASKLNAVQLKNCRS